jgi:hypothetical protein
VSDQPPEPPALAVHHAGGTDALTARDLAAALDLVRRARRASLGRLQAQAEAPPRPAEEPPGDADGQAVAPGRR